MRWLVTILGLGGSAAAGHLGRRWIAEAGRASVGALTPAASHDAVVLAMTGYVLLGSMVAAIFGSVLAWQRRGRASGTVLLVAGVVPGIFDLRAFMATCVLIMASMLAYGLTQPGRAWPARSNVGS